MSSLGERFHTALCECGPIGAEASKRLTQQTAVIHALTARAELAERQVRDQRRTIDRMTTELRELRMREVDA